VANALTSATPEDAALQGQRLARAVARDTALNIPPTHGRPAYWRQCCGWSIGRGFEADYLEGMRVADAVRYALWLRRWAA
jgi:hypothetical protein